MATMEELMLIFRAKDEVSGVTGQIDNEVQSMASSAQAALANMTSGMANISTVSDNLIGSLNGGKSASELIFGTASKAETNKVLVNNMTQTKEAAEELYSTVDKVTDSSLTSMQDLIPALNAFKAATGASDDEIKDITDDMANFGAAVLAQTGSTALAETAMMSLSKGIKGAFAALDQYGVSEDALKRTGKWQGDEKDVRGFMEAVTEVMGSTEALMETNQGLDALIQKAFSRGGKKIGNEFLPVIKDVKRAFIDLDNSLGGNLTALILSVGAGIDIMNSALFNVSTAVRGFQDLKDGVKGLAGLIKGIAGIGDAAKDTTDAVKGMGDALSAVSNAGEMGANVTSMGAAGAGVAEMGKTASKGEKAAEGAGDALLMADMLKGAKNDNKDYKKLLKELGESAKYQSEVSEQMDTISSLKFTTFKSGKVLGLPEKEIKNITTSTSGYLESLFQSVRDGLDGKTLKTVMKENDSAKQKAGELLKESLSYDGIFDDDLLDEWKKSEMGLTDAIKDIDFKAKLKAPFTKISEGFSGLGEPLQNALKKGFTGIGNFPQMVKGKFGSFTSSLSQAISSIKMPDIKSKLGNLNKSLYQGISSFSFTDTLSGLKDKISGLRGATEVVSEIDDVVDGVEGVADAAQAVGAAAPAMEAGAAGAEAGAVATTSLSAAFTSMIVPALALAAVVAIMIPVVAGLAAEALLFIKLLGEFMDALNFDSINLDGTVEGLKQIATGLAYVGAAMLAMTGVSILVGINSMITLFTGITGPLKTAVNALTTAADELKQFENIHIDQNVGNNLKTISDSLTAISSAMLGLTSVTITTGFSGLISWAFKFKSIGDSLTQAKNHIMEASTKLNEFSGLTPLPDNVAQNIQNVCNSLDSVGKAISALKSIRDSNNFDILGGLGQLFGGIDIGAALNSVKTDIYNAATALQGWSVPDVPQDIGSRIQAVSDALGSLKSGLESMKSIAQSYDGGFIGWIQGGLFGGTDIQGSIDRAISEINQIATKLSSIQVAAIPDLSFIERVSVGLNYLKQAGTQLSQFSGFTISEDVPEKVRLAVEAVTKVASQLSGITTANIGDINGLLTTINTALDNIRATLTNAGGSFSAPAMNIGTGIVSGVQSGLAPLGGVVQSSVSSGISSANGVATSGGQQLGTSATEAFRGSLKLADVARSEMDYAVQAINNGSGPLADAARQAAEKAVQAAKDGADAHSPGAIARMWGTEFGVYSPQKIMEGANALVNAARTVSEKVVNAWNGGPGLDLTTSMNSLTPGQLQSMDLMNSPAPNTTTGNTTTIIIQEGAIPIDARNMTQKEARQMLILALESLDLFDPNPEAKGVA